MRCFIPAIQDEIGSPKNGLICFPWKMDSLSLVPKQYGLSKYITEVLILIKLKISKIVKLFLAQDAGIKSKPFALFLFLCKKLTA